MTDPYEGKLLAFGRAPAPDGVPDRIWLDVEAHVMPPGFATGLVVFVAERPYGVRLHDRSRLWLEARHEGLEDELEAGAPWRCSKEETQRFREGLPPSDAAHRPRSPFVPDEIRRFFKLPKHVDLEAQPKPDFVKAEHDAAAGGFLIPKEIVGPMLWELERKPGPLERAWRRLFRGLKKHGIDVRLPRLKPRDFFFGFYFGKLHAWRSTKPGIRTFERTVYVVLLPMLVIPVRITRSRPDRRVRKLEPAPVVVPIEPGVLEDGRRLVGRRIELQAPAWFKPEHMQAIPPSDPTSRAPFHPIRWPVHDEVGPHDEDAGDETT